MADPTNGYKVYGVYQYMSDTGEIAMYQSHFRYWLYLCESGNFRERQSNTKVAGQHSQAYSAGQLVCHVGSGSSPYLAFEAVKTRGYDVYDYSASDKGTLTVNGQQSTVTVPEGYRKIEEGFAAIKSVTWLPVLESGSSSAKSIAGAVVSAVADQTYTGKAIEPKPTVKLGSTTLKANTDYTLSYKNNTKAGTATIVITGKGSYTGTKSVTFRIVEKATPATPVATQQMYRLYNPNSGEHFYTAKAAERDALRKAGWRYEGIGWVAPQKSNTPVYRLYNANAGDHHYTMKAKEKDALTKVGWKYEGIGWCSDDAKALKVYRQYNPNAASGSHNYTTSKAENDALVKMGWKAEGVGWYAAEASSKQVLHLTGADFEFPGPWYGIVDPVIGQTVGTDERVLSNNGMTLLGWDRTKAAAWDELRESGKPSDYRDVGMETLADGTKLIYGRGNSGLCSVEIENPQGRKGFLWTFAYVDGVGGYSGANKDALLENQRLQAEVAGVSPNGSSYKIADAFLRACALRLTIKG